MGAKQDDARGQMLDTGIAPGPSASALERELEARVKMPGGPVKTGHRTDAFKSGGNGGGSEDCEEADVERKELIDTTSSVI